MNHEIFLQSLRRHTDGKLLGRDQEVQQLQDIYQQVVSSQSPKKPQAVFVYGYSGSGKSQLIHYALKKKQGSSGGAGYFVTGKYDQLSTRGSCRSYSALTDACRSLCLELHNDEREAFQEPKQQAIQLMEKTLVKDAAILSNLLPELVTLVPALFNEDTAHTTSSSMAGHFQFDRLKIALKTFLACISRFIPICIFIDDLQWACPASIDIIESLLLQTNTSTTTTINTTTPTTPTEEPETTKVEEDFATTTGDLLGDTGEETTTTPTTTLEVEMEVEMEMLLFVGAYRDNELVLGEHPLANSIQRLEQLDCSTKIHVSDLSLPNLNLFIATLLGFDDENDSITFPLSQSIHQRTHGNIFFVLQFLEMLVSTNILQYSFVTMKWERDTNQLFEQTGSTQNVIDLLLRRMKRLPPTTALALIVASHLGNRFEANILKLVLDRWQTTTTTTTLDDYRDSSSSSSLRNLNLGESWTAGSVTTSTTPAPAGLVLLAEEDDDNKEQESEAAAAATTAAKEKAVGKGEAARDNNNKFEFLNLLIEEGFIVGIDNVTGGIWYRFLHDRIQQAAAEGLIDNPSESKALRYRLGTLLLDINKTTPQKTWAALSAVDLLNTTKDLVLEDRNHKHHRLELAKANIQAAKIAASQSAFGTAAEYLGHCRSLFTTITTTTNTSDAVSSGEARLWQDHYDLAVQMYTMSAEMSFCCGKLKECLEMFQQVKIHRKQPKDSWLASYVAMKALGEEAKYEDSIHIAYEVLNETGFHIPLEGVTPQDVGMAYGKAKTELMKRTNQEILNLHNEEMDDAGDVIWKIFSAAMLFVWHAGRLLDHAYLACNMTIRTMEKGLSEYSGQTFAVQAISCIVNDDFDLVKRLSKLWNHPDIAKRYIGKEIEAGTRAAGNGPLSHLFQPLTLVAEGFMKGYESGMKTGALEWATTNAGCFLLTLFMSGLPLSQFERDSWTLIKEMKRYGNRIHRPMCELYLQCSLHLMGKAAGEPVGHTTTGLQGEATKEYNLHQIMAGNCPDEFPINVAWFAQLMLSYYFDDFETAAEMAVKHEDFGPVDWPMVWSIPQPYYRGLAYVAKVRLLQDNNFIKKKKKTAMQLLSRCCGGGWFSKRREIRFYFERAKNQLSLLKGYVEHGLINTFHMYKILQAEVESITPGSKSEEVIQLYKDAIRCAKRSGFQQDAALASERIAVYYMTMAPTTKTKSASSTLKAVIHADNNNNNNVFAASLHIQSSLDDYESWGAHKKADLLRSKYQDLSLTGGGDDDDCSDCSASSRRFTLSQPFDHDSKVKFTRSIMSSQPPSLSLLSPQS